MSEQPEADSILEWDLADRMRKALRHAQMESKQMADYLEVSQASVSAWINGRSKPSKQTVRLWAMRTGVSYGWLCHGDHAPCPGDAGKPVSAGQRKVITGTYSHRRPSAAIGARFLPAAA